MGLKDIFKFLLLLGLGSPCIAQSFPERTWVSSTGVEIQARMLGFDGTKVTIERSDARKFAFPLTLLSPKDQQYRQDSLVPKEHPPKQGFDTILTGCGFECSGRFADLEPSGHCSVVGGARL